MAKNIAILTFLFLSIDVFSQEVIDYKIDFSRLKREYRNLTETEVNVDNFKEEIEEINQKVGYIKKEVESFAQKNTSKKDEAEQLLKEIVEFYLFTMSKPRCNCTFYLNKFITEFGGQSTLLKEQDNIKIFYAKINNFKYYYAYSKKNQLQTVTIKIGSTIHTFGIMNEIDIFKITEINKNLTISKIQIEVKGEEEKINYGTSCRNEFPRN